MQQETIKPIALAFLVQVVLVGTTCPAHAQPEVTIPHWLRPISI
jgi:hypothetical protein